jgi:hypothetical protein
MDAKQKASNVVKDSCGILYNYDMKLQLIYNNLHNNISVSVFINNKGCGNLCMKKQEFKELCDGLKTLYKDIDIKEEE